MKSLNTVAIGSWIDQSGNGQFGIGKPTNAANVLLGGSLILSDSFKSKTPELKSVIELREYTREIELSEKPGLKFKHAIIHWIGDSANDHRELFAAFLMEGNPCEKDCRDTFNEQLFIAKTYGSFAPQPERVGKIKSAPKAAVKSFADKQRDQDITNAMRSYLRKIYPAAMSTGNPVVLDAEAKLKRAEDPIDAAIIANWFKWQHLREKAACAEFVKLTGIKISPANFKKRRQRLDLTVTCKPGPDEKSVR